MKFKNQTSNNLKKGNIKVLFSVFILIFLFGCKDAQIRRKKTLHGFLEGKFKDSVYDGLVNYYDTNQKLVRSEMYWNGLLNGSVKNFYADGKVSDSLNYTLGWPDGFHCKFQTNGDIQYMDFYVKGIYVGPEIFYNGHFPEDFYFFNFEKSIIYQVHYDSIGRVDKFRGELGNCNTYAAMLNENNACGIFAFLIHPPGILMKYSIVVKDTNTTEQETIVDFDKSKVFVDTVLKSPASGSKYFFIADFKDTLHKVSRVYVDELNYANN